MFITRHCFCIVDPLQKGFLRSSSFRAEGEAFVFCLLLLRFCSDHVPAPIERHVISIAMTCRVAGRACGVHFNGTPWLRGMPLQSSSNVLVSACSICPHPRLPARHAPWLTNLCQHRYSAQNEMVQLTAPHIEVYIFIYNFAYWLLHHAFVHVGGYYSVIAEADIVIVPPPPCNKNFGVQLRAESWY